MSYEIVKGLSINLSDLSAVFRSSSNNVFPKSYSPFTYTFTRYESHSPLLTDKEIFILLLLKDVHGGSLQLQQSVSAKVRWAFFKTFDAFISHPEIIKFEYKLYDFIENAVYKSSNLDLAREISQTFEDIFNKKDVLINKVVYLNNYKAYLSDTYYSRKRGMQLKYSSSLDNAKTYKSQKELDLLENDLNNRFRQTPFTIVDFNMIKNELPVNDLFNTLEIER